MGKTRKNNVKTRIEKAFAKILMQKPFIEITVAEVVSVAGVSRASFYRHFKSMDDVLESITQFTSNDMMSIFQVVTENSERRWREFLFETIDRYVSAKKELGFSLSDAMTKHTFGVVLSRIGKKVTEEANKRLTSPEGKYKITGKLALIYAIVRRWDETGANETPEQIVNFIMSIIVKF